MKVRRKPETLDAVQVTADWFADYAVVIPGVTLLRRTQQVSVMTVNGWRIANIGDWIIAAADGTRAIELEGSFEQCFESVDDEVPAEKRRPAKPRELS